MASLREIGQTLKSAREAQGLGLDELSARSRISVRHLVAIEEGNEADLPEVFYVRGFLKKYAEAVGLSPTEVADAYRTAPIPQPTEAPRGVAVGPIAYYMLIVALIGVALFLAWHFQPRVSVVAESPSPVPSTPVATPSPSPSPQAQAAASGVVASDHAATGAVAVASPASSPAPTQPPSPAVRPSAPVSPQASAPASPKPTAAATAAPTPKPTPRSTPKPTPATKQVSLFIQERAWVEVQVDGVVQFEGLMLPGTSRRFSGQTIVITAGNAGGVRLTLNGQDRGVLGDRGVVVTRTY